MKCALKICFSGKLYEVGYKFKWTRPFSCHEGYDLPFYIGMISNNDNDKKNQWKWSSTGRIMSKDYRAKLFHETL